jgi:hypothetical protein
VCLSIGGTLAKDDQGALRGLECEKCKFHLRRIS